MRRNITALSVLILLFGCGCGGHNSGPTVTPPGGPTRAKTRALEAGAKMLQDKEPLEAISTYLNAFHWYSGDMGRQVEAHHYCTHGGNEDLMQCVIYDGNGPGARLIGVEHIVSERVFASLPPEEQRLWHSHQFESKSGTIIFPGLPQAAETAAVQHIANTYGKTWHFWQVDRGDKLPLGIPQLMMGFTADGQVDPNLLADRDKRFKVNAAEERKKLAKVTTRPVHPAANAWEKGEVLQLELRRMDGVRRSPTSVPSRAAPDAVR